MTDTTTNHGDDGPETCPAWCDVPDHRDRDGGNGSHSAAHYTIDLTLGVHADPDDHACIYVGLDRDPGRTEPYVSLTASLDDGDHEMRLTPEEAAAVASGLILMGRKGLASIEYDRQFVQLARGLAIALNGRHLAAVP